MGAPTLRRLVAILAVFAGIVSAAAADIKIDAQLDKTRAALGEPILLTVTAHGDAGVKWEERSVADRLGSFEIEQAKGPEPLPAPKNGEPAEPGTRWIFRLAAFELGKLDVPPIQLRYTPDGGGEAAGVETPALSVEIVSTVSKDTKPADVRHGFTLPPNVLFWVLVVAGALAGAAILWAIVRRLRRRETPAAEPAPGPPPRPAYERCMEALAALLAEKLVQAGRYKEFHVRIAEIVKGYLGEVCGFDAVDRTSWEVNAELAVTEAPAPLRAAVRGFLEACDAVKFAKHVPAIEEADATVASARSIAKLARPRPEAAAGEPAASQTASAARSGA